MTLGELLIATAITMSLTAAIVGLIQPAQNLFDTQPELSDMQQRLRVGVDTLVKDLLMAAAPVRPYRVGQRQSDPDAGIFYRPDTITLVAVPWDDAATRADTYYLKSDIASNTFQLMHYDGAETDLPVVDNMVKLEFEYFSNDRLRLDPATLQDGPWLPDEVDPNRFDSDLLNIRRVQVTLRVQAARAALRGPAGILFLHGGTAGSMGRYVPDREIRFDVSPRNLNFER